MHPDPIGITAGTRTFALLGDPIVHSLSPIFQNAAIRAAGLDAVYVALRCSAGDAPRLLAAIARAGGGGNVTTPHKIAVLGALERSTDEVRKTGACNTFWLERGRVTGDNTDVAGFDAAVRSLVADPHGARTLVIGAGGAARAAVVALIRAGVSRIDLLNRTPEKASDLAHRIDPRGLVVHTARLEDVRDEPFDLVVNATRLGLYDGDPEPLDLRTAGAIGAVLDLVYRKEGTPWMRTATALGLPAADGTAMLLHQGAAAFERWFAMSAPLEAMREALNA